jgi:ABC-type cobalamin/Fe3+-siderophores transport system ATPase subunit
MEESTMATVSEGRDRITYLRVVGMRSLADVRLPLGGLTVLIGDNGSGKSSLLEALELLRKAAQPGNFITDQLEPFHWNLGSMLRVGAQALRLGVRIEGGGPPIEYSFALARQAYAPMIVEELLDVWPLDPETTEPTRFIARDASQWRVSSIPKLLPRLPPGQLALTALGAMAPPEVSRVLHVLGSGRVHVPFDVLPLWLAVEQQRTSPLRQPAQIGRTHELERFGLNLANCYFALAQEQPPEVWQRTLERVRAGLGPDVTDIRTPSAGRGQIELAVHFRGLARPILANALSDGQLAYLAFVALAELGKEHSFIAFDEPELHFHPQLLVRVTWLLEELAQSCPVIVSTHSDRLLDALYDPAKSVVLCDLDEHRATRLYRPDTQALAEWLKQYRGFGELRAEGYDRHVLTEPVGGRE